MTNSEMKDQFVVVMVPESAGLARRQESAAIKVLPWLVAALLVCIAGVMLLSSQSSQGQMEMAAKNGKSSRLQHFPVTNERSKMITAKMHAIQTKLDEADTNDEADQSDDEADQSEGPPADQSEGPLDEADQSEGPPADQSEGPLDEADQSEGPPAICSDWELIHACQEEDSTQEGISDECFHRAEPHAKNFEECQGITDAQSVTPECQQKVEAVMASCEPALHDWGAWMWHEEQEFGGALNFFGAPNGEQACEGHDLDEEYCNAVGCCQWDSSDGKCWSAVGAEVCHAPADGESHASDDDGGHEVEEAPAAEAAPAQPEEEETQAAE
jgi:cell division protein FtsN